MNKKYFYEHLTVRNVNSIRNKNHMPFPSNNISYKEKNKIFFFLKYGIHNNTQSIERTESNQISLRNVHINSE
jgi:hypothetical protein